jgi:hypothetical protein
MKTGKQFKVEHGPAKWNWAHGERHNTGLVVIENPVKPKIIPQERLAEIKELQIQSTDALERFENIEEQLEWKLKSIRDDLAKGLPVEEGSFEAHLSLRNDLCYRPSGT